MSENEKSMTMEEAHGSLGSLARSIHRRRKKLVGRVVSDTSAPGRALKTVTVEVVRRFRDPLYGKYVKRRSHYHAHDEDQRYRTRDLVEIEEHRPISRTKRWIVTKLMDRPPEV